MKLKKRILLGCVFIIKKFSCGVVKKMSRKSELFLNRIDLTQRIDLGADSIMDLFDDLEVHCWIIKLFQGTVRFVGG